MLLEFNGEAEALRHVADAIAEFWAQLLNKVEKRNTRPQRIRSILSNDEKNLEACFLLINSNNNNNKQAMIIVIKLDIQISNFSLHGILNCTCAKLFSDPEVLCTGYDPSTSR